MSLSNKLTIVFLLCISISLNRPLDAINTQTVIGSMVVGSVACSSTYAMLSIARENYRLRNRTHEEVYNEAHLFFKKTEIAYRSFIDLVDKITPEMKYFEYKIQHDTLIRYAANQNATVISLIVLIDQFEKDINTLKKHRESLITHTEMMNDILDVSIMEKSKELIQECSHLISRLETIKTIIMESHTYLAEFYRTIFVVWGTIGIAVYFLVKKTLSSLDEMQ